MITTLDRKLLRDIGGMKGQVLVVSLVMACGVAMMIVSQSVIMSLERTRDAYYQHYRMPDVFGVVSRASLVIIFESFMLGHCLFPIRVPFGTRRLFLDSFL